MEKELANIRKEYLKGSISVDTMPENPLEALQTWVNQAIESEVEEPTAMNIATISSGKFPNSRVVLLKEINSEGLVFFTNYKSQKGQDIATNPNVAINFFWPELERQVRIHCVASKVSDLDSDTYFYSRPKTSQVGAIVSAQSAEIGKDEDLESKITEIIESNLEIKRPEYWGGYILVPEYFEFWHGRASRIHDRVAFSKTTGAWIKKRLSP
jgi:pyridoxamine 5'-phosphate oxidase